MAGTTILLIYHFWKLSTPPQPENKILQFVLDFKNKILFSKNSIFCMALLVEQSQK